MSYFAPTFVRSGPNDSPSLPTRWHCEHSPPASAATPTIDPSYGAFTAAGGHFDPGPASNTDPDVNHPFHMGDIPNLQVGADGKGEMKVTTTRVTLSDGPLSVFDADGTAIIVHGNEDRETPGAAKSGVSGGPRVACGVLVKK